MGRLPEQLDRGVGERLVLLVVDALIGLRKLQPQRICPATEEHEAGPVFGVVARLHRGVDERWLVPGRVEGELRRVFGTNHKLIDAGLGRRDRSCPADGKPIGLEPLRVGPLDAEEEIDLRIGPFEDEILAVKGAAVEILTAEAAPGIDIRPAAAKAGDQVGHRVVVLPDGKPREFHAGGPVAVAGHWRIKRPVDVFGDLAGRLVTHRLRIVLRHRLVDVGCELVDRPVTDKRRGHIHSARTVLGMAAAAVLAIDGRAGMLVGRASANAARACQDNPCEDEGDGGAGGQPGHAVFPWSL